MLAQICQKIYQKPVKECTKEELYLALLEMTKKLAKEKEFTKEQESLLYFGRVFNWKAFIEQFN